MNQHTISGKFMGAGKAKTVGTNNYVVRSFWIQVEGNPQYPNTPEFQLTGQNVTLIDNVQQFQEIEVSFRVEGRKWERDGKKGVITNLTAFKISVIRRENPVAQPAQQPVPVAVPAGGDDDLPF